MRLRRALDDEDQAELLDAQLLYAENEIEQWPPSAGSRWAQKVEEKRRLDTLEFGFAIH